ncbi:helix-turn-helix domain-containing protein [Vibrio quintilis]|uniref:Uncharacterized protein n=1 Tax=Vibrio quintilis TaxID=1117707 RepID=A0A1M7YPE2_9VIBR|nr:helix-turn-helix transcriptional regulator [Vibrio quintilis]SHO54494.1 hypothetical protein VQ7734_00208 [Vibrio quintilis]
MNPNKITGVWYFEARQTVGLSLSAVSKMTGINRNYLSQFEQEKTTLDNRQRNTLKAFYEERGYSFESPQEPDAEVITEQYQQAKSDVQSCLDRDNGATAQALSGLIDSVHDIMMNHHYFHEATTQQVQISLVPAVADTPENQQLATDYRQTAKLLTGLFEADQKGEFAGCCGFWGEAADDRADKYQALLALQQLRLMKLQAPGLFELSYGQAPEKSDNARLLSRMMEHLNDKSVLNGQTRPELGQVSGKVIE